MIKKFFKENTTNLPIQFFRYGFVGIGVTLFDFSVLFVLTEFFGVYYLISAAIAYLVGFFANYLLCVYWVFGNQNKNKVAEMGRLSFVGIVGLVLTALLMWFFTGYLGLYYMFSNLVAAMAVFFWNFFARRHIVFGRFTY